MRAADKPSLLFVSPQMLFPMDAGGKIRSANILRRLKGGAFRTRLVMPAAAEDGSRWAVEIAALADEVALFRPLSPPARKARRAAGFFSGQPLSAFVDAHGAAKRAISLALARSPDLVVFDYAQSFALADAEIAPPAILFAHNVETEILDRHHETARGPMRLVYAREAAKMRRFESAAAQRSAMVIAVSERDADMFGRNFGARAAAAIPTGVDSDYFRFAPPADDAPPHFVFTGSMDWSANADGVSWFMDHVWPLIAAARADASFTVVGKNPPRALVERAREKQLAWRFTGFVDDVRPPVAGACAFLIPLRVGGGTRIKAFEAMAMGLPLVSTALGVEGLPVRNGENCLIADTPREFADATLALARDGALRRRLAASSRALVENNYAHEAASHAFEKHCLAVLNRAR